VYFFETVDWAPASLFLAQLCQSLGPFIEWGVAGGAVVTRWRDSALVEIVKKRYIGNKEQEKKTRQVLLDYFQVKFNIVLSLYSKMLMLRHC